MLGLRHGRTNIGYSRVLKLTRYSCEFARHNSGIRCPLYRISDKVEQGTTTRHQPKSAVERKLLGSMRRWFGKLVSRIRVGTRSIANQQLHQRWRASSDKTRASTSAIASWKKGISSDGIDVTPKLAMLLNR